MGVNSSLLLELRSTGFANGQVFLHTGANSVSIYHGPAAKAVYDAMKRFLGQHKDGFGEFYEQQTSSGMQLRERKESK